MAPGHRWLGACDECPAGQHLHGQYDESSSRKSHALSLWIFCARLMSWAVEHQTAMHGGCSLTEVNQPHRGACYTPSFLFPVPLRKQEFHEQTCWHKAHTALTTAFAEYYLPASVFNPNMLPWTACAHMTLSPSLVYVVLCMDHVVVYTGCSWRLYYATQRVRRGFCVCRCRR